MVGSSSSKYITFLSDVQLIHITARQSITEIVVTWGNDREFCNIGRSTSLVRVGFFFISTGLNKTDSWRFHSFSV